jgi:uncharacterized membrane-anchored protein
MTTRRIYTAGSDRDHTPIRRSALVKVPEITAMFWIVKILTTGMGETCSDFLVQHLIPALAVLLGLVVFVAAVVRQLRAPRYLPWVYWFAVVMVSVFGTMAADVVHKGFGVPYLVSTVAFSIALAAIFVVWYRSEGTLSIHSIDSPRRERFYWAAVLATFALGTAAGDMTATTLHLGYLASGILFTVAIAIPWVLWARYGLNPIVAFWAAYILTRPLGASFADWMAVSPHRGGLGWGTGPVSLVLTLLIIVGVARLQAAETRRVTRARETAPLAAYATDEVD